MQRQERTGHFHVNSKEQWNMFYDGVNSRVQSNRQFTQDFLHRHKSSIAAEKVSHKEALDLTTRQNICKPKTMSKQKFAFQICLTHVLFPKITSIKRQMQTQETTGHFRVHSIEEWNMFYDGVNNRVQSNRQFTQDLRQWHKSSIEAEKNISQGSNGPYNTPQQLRTGKKIQQKKSPFNYFQPMCYSQTSQA